MFAKIGYYICIPFAWLLRIFYGMTNSYGLALILFTLVVKLVLLPFQFKSKKSMIRMNKFQPKLKEIQDKYANNQQKMNEEIQLLYAREGINPMSGCLWSLLPFPIIIALYSIIRQPLSRFMLLSAETIERVRGIAAGLGYVAEQTGGRASFYEEIQLAQFVNNHFDSFSGVNGLIRMDYNFLGLDLTVVPQNVLKQFFTGGWPVIGLVLIPVISAALSFVQSKLAMAGSNQNAKADDPAARSSRTMMYTMPLMSLWIGFTLPAALGVYWIANSVFQAIQDLILNKVFSEQMEKEETEKEKAKREARVAKMMAAREQQRAYQEAAAKGKASQKPQKPQKKQPERKGASTSEAGRLGDRPYARGRSYDPDRYRDYDPENFKK